MDQGCVVDLTACCCIAQVPFLFDKFDPKAHIPHWPVAKNEHKTVFALQYGLRDGLAPARLARTLEKLLRNEGLSVQV
jgi:hypothetical protein